MEEWEMARSRSRACLHFLGSLYAPELEYRYLGGGEEIFENGARILERLWMLNPPRATDLRLSKLGQDAGMRDSNRRVWERMDRLKDGGWHVSGYAVCRDDRPPDLILFRIETLMESGWCAQRRFLLAPLPSISATARDTISNSAGLRKTRNSARGRLIFRLESLAPRKGGLSRLGRWISPGGVITTILKAIESFPFSRQ